MTGGTGKTGERAGGRHGARLVERLVRSSDESVLRTYKVLGKIDSYRIH